MGTLADLQRRLRQLDGRGYKAYKEIAGRWDADGFTLAIDHVQGDPFATPSRLRLLLPAAHHRLPPALHDTRPRRVALCDYLLRQLAGAAARLPRGSGMGNSGRVLVDAGGAEILERSGCAILSPLDPTRGDDDHHRVELRFRVGLPAQGRRVLGHAAAALLTEHLPALAARLRWPDLDQAAARRWVEVTDDHAHLQQRLAERDLVAFVRDGSLLPRRSGVSSQPLTGAVPFATPPELRVTLPTRHHGEVTGMGVPSGITLITGGGFHGKTTLLEAIQLGVYPHIPGDGREWVATRADAVKVRSEDGRSVVGVDVRPFIDDLPARGGVKDTAAFTTADASGSTSLAAAILEALELGATALLIDEDTAATNLLVRDARMQALVARETITPLIDRARELHEALGVSLLLVAGGSGDYLEVADHVVLLEDYAAREVSADAARITRAHPTRRRPTADAAPLVSRSRYPAARSFDPRGGRGADRGREGGRGERGGRGGRTRGKVKARGEDALLFGESTIDLSAVEQIVDPSQVRAIGVLLEALARAPEDQPLVERVRAVIAEAEDHGLWSFDRSPELALPRPFELGAAINRLRSLTLVPGGSGG